MERVADRVRKGGHNIPEADIRRRYGRSIYNFLHIYQPLADNWILFDNSGSRSERSHSREPSNRLYWMQSLTGVLRRQR